MRHGHPTQSNGSDSGPYRTLYGAVWSTSVGGQPSGTSTADSAYSSVSLPLHTDMTYHATPPGAPRQRPRRLGVATTNVGGSHGRGATPG